jgi:hypothetical protein
MSADDVNPHAPTPDADWHGYRRQLAYHVQTTKALEMTETHARPWSRPDDTVPEGTTVGEP